MSVEQPHCEVALLYLACFHVEVEVSYPTMLQMLELRSCESLVRSWGSNSSSTHQHLEHKRSFTAHRSEELCVLPGQM
jgi:hypothetical protein